MMKEGITTCHYKEIREEREREIHELKSLLNIAVRGWGEAWRSLSHLTSFEILATDWDTNNEGGNEKTSSE